MLPELVVAWLALAAPVSAAERCMVTDPTGTLLNVCRFDGKVIGALHNGAIVKILRTSADRTGKPGPMSARPTEKVGFIGSSSAATGPDLWGLGRRFLGARKCAVGQ
jgi:hypothetical protein